MEQQRIENGGSQYVPQIAVQYVYLDFDGELTSYNGEILTVDNVEVLNSSLTAERIANIVAELNAKYASQNVIFVTQRPKTAGYSTIFIGKTSAFDSYGNFTGLAETIDKGNKITTDNAFVMLDSTATDTEIITTIAHETDHLLGTLDHGGEGLAVYAARIIVSEGIISSGLTVVYGNSMFISSGGTAYDTVLNGNYEDAYMYIANGGYASNTTVASGRLYISSGGTAENTELQDGTLVVYSGGSVAGLTAQSGTLLEIRAGGKATGLNILDGATTYFTITNDTVLEGSSKGKEILVSDGVISNVTIISSCYMNVESDWKAYNTVLNGNYEDAYMYIKNGGYASNTTVASGRLYISSGGIAAHTDLQLGRLIIYSGGSAAKLTAQSGTLLEILAGGKATGLNILDGATTYFTITNDTVLEGSSKGKEILVSDGVISNVTIISSCSMNVESDWKAYNTVLNGKYESAYMYIKNGGYASNTTVASGILYISSGGTAEMTTVQTGLLRVSANGAVGGVTIQSGARLTLLAGGTATDIDIQQNGIAYLDITAQTCLTGISGGQSILASDGVISNVTIISNCSMNVESDWKAYNTVLNGKYESAYMYVLDGGYAETTSITSGKLYISSGGEVQSSVLRGGAIYVKNGGCLQNTVASAGNVYISSGGKAINMDVLSGAKVYVNAGGSFTSINLQSGATLILSSGAILESLNYEEGAVISAAGKAVMQGSLDKNTAFDQNILNGLSIENKNFVYRINSKDKSLFGKYLINDSIGSWNGTISLYANDLDTGAEFILSSEDITNETVLVDGVLYTLSEEEGKLYLIQRQVFTCESFYYDDEQRKGKIIFTNELSSNVDYAPYITIKNTSGEEFRLGNIFVRGNELDFSLDLNPADYYTLRISPDLPNILSEKLNTDGDITPGEENEDCYTQVFSPDLPLLTIQASGKNSITCSHGEPISIDCFIAPVQEVGHVGMKSSLEIYLSSDAILDSSDKLFSSYIFDEVPPEGLTLKCDLDSSQLTLGNFYLIIKADDMLRGLQEGATAADCNIETIQVSNRLDSISGDPMANFDWNKKFISLKYSRSYSEFLSQILARKYGTSEGGYTAWLNDIRDDVSKIGFSESSEEIWVKDGVKILDGSFMPLPRNILISSEVEIGSNSLQISISKTWSVLPSDHFKKGVFGYGWISSLDTRLIRENINNFTVLLPNGEKCSFALNDGTWVGNIDGYSLTEYGNGYGIRDAQGIDYKYSLDGRFLYMQNVDGERITATWKDYQELFPESGINDRSQKVLTELKHSDGSFLKFSYNDKKCIISIISSSEKNYYYSYDDAGNLIAVRDKASTIIGEYTYDSTIPHTLTSSRDKNGNKRNFTCDEFGRIVSIQDNNKSQLNIVYDGFTISVCDQNNVGITYTMTPHGQLSSVSDSRGNQVFYTYDTSGNLLSVTDEAGNKETYTYNSDGKLTESVNVLGQKESFTYQDNKVVQKDIYGKQTSIEYYDDGKIATIREPDGSAYYLEYDKNGFLTKVTGNDCAEIIFTNDSRGNVTQIVSDTKTVSFTYDSSNNITSIVDAYGRTSFFSYDADNQLTAYTDNAGNKTYYSYTELGQVASITYANGGREDFVYDSEGNMLSWTNMRGEKMDFSVNAAGEPASSYVAGNTVTYQYDIYNQLISANDISFTYDKKGNILTQSYQDGRKLTYTYDQYGCLTSMTDEKGNASVYAYDRYGNLDTVKDGSGNIIADYDYNSFGQLTKQTNGTKSYTTYTYNTDGSVKKISYYSNSILQDFCDYSYDTNGLCIAKSSNAGTWNYEYDLAGRLTREVFTDKSGTIEQENSYTYDSVGNRLTKVEHGVLTTYTYNNMNQIVSANGFAYKYDADGNLVEDEERTYTWTKDNRVASETLKSTGQVWTYGYDALGNRCSVTTNGVTTEYMVDSKGNVIAEYVNGKQTRNYYHGLSLIGFNEEGSDYFYNQDMLGSTVSVMSSTGTQVNCYSYDAFGNCLSATEGIENAFEFVGGSGLMKNASGTIFVRARNYDSESGRWISMDPLGIAGGSNLYEYCGSNPAIFIDESGYAYCPVHGDDDGYTISDGSDLIDNIFGTLTTYAEYSDEAYLLTHGGALTPANDIIISRAEKFSKLGAVISVVTSTLSIYDGITQRGFSEGARRSYQAAGSLAGSAFGSMVGKTVFSGIGMVLGGPIGAGIGLVAGGLIGGCLGGKLGGSIGSEIGDYLLPPDYDCNHSTIYCPSDDDNTPTQPPSDANKGREISFELDGKPYKTIYYNSTWTMTHTAGVMMDGPYKAFPYEIRAFVGGQDIGIVAAGTACNGKPSESLRISAAITMPAGLELSGNSITIVLESKETKYTASGKEYIDRQIKSIAVSVIEQFNIDPKDMSCWMAAGANVLANKTGGRGQEIYDSLKESFKSANGVLSAGNGKLFADFVNTHISGAKITPKYAKESFFSYLFGDDRNTIQENITVDQLADFIADNGPCVLSISNPNQDPGHAITVYKAHDNGDGTGYIVIADSDDKHSGLVTVNTYIDEYGRTHLEGYGDNNWYSDIAYTFDVTGDMNFTINSYAPYILQKTVASESHINYKIIQKGESVNIENGISASHIAIAETGTTTVKSGGVIENVVTQKGSVLILETGAVISGNITLSGEMAVNGEVNAEHSLINFNIINRNFDDDFIITNAENLKNASFCITLSNTLETGRYQLASGFGEQNPEFTVFSDQDCANNGWIMKAGDAKAQIGRVLVEIVRENGNYYIDIVSREDASQGVNLHGDKHGISWDGLNGYWEVEYSNDNFEHIVSFSLSNTQIDTFALQQGTWQYRIKYYDATCSSSNVIENTNVTQSASIIKSDKDGNTDVFFANASGTWGSGYTAQHIGILNGWTGTNEQATLIGKNKIVDVFNGSTDANILVLTDDANGDTLFVEDIYTSFGKDAARIAQIDEIRAGLGDDIVDMTSQRFAYVGDGVKVYGGLGNDTIWANNGSNTLFGDAGNDRIVGGSGDDIIIGGIGNDSMHGGGGSDIFCFGGNWGTDTIEQLAGGAVTLWFETGSESNWNADTMTFSDGSNSVKVSGVDTVTLKFGADASLPAGCFADAASEKIFEDKDSGMLA